ncbi:MAG: LuxR family transcriptional regulator [Bacteroidales bacterium]|nr:LuxR family transcriptional regulator [Bacteroidales bacterium]
MRKLSALIILMLFPVALSAYKDYRGYNLDSLEHVTARLSPERFASASYDELYAYGLACRDLAWGYLQLDAYKSVYYARQCMSICERLEKMGSKFDMLILIGQHFYSRELYDSARVYYNEASALLERMEPKWKEESFHDFEAMQARLWGTLGNFYAMQDSVPQLTYYYGKAGEIFEKWEWWEDCSTLHRNLGEVYLDYGDMERSREEYDKAFDFAQMTGDSLIVAGAMYGLGRWYQTSGKTRKAIEYLSKAYEYFGKHYQEESRCLADTMEVMNAAHAELYRNARMMAIGAVLLLVLLIGGVVVSSRLKATKKELTETSAVLEETIEDIHPVPEAEIPLTDQERRILGLLAEGLSTKEIADKMCLGTNTILWYRKRLFAKFDVHSVAALVSEAHRLGLVGYFSA